MYKVNINTLYSYTNVTGNYEKKCQITNLKN